MNGSRKMQKAVCAFLLGTTLFSCSDQKEIQITGTVRNLNGGMIVYQQSIAGMMNSKTVDTLQIQSDSTFADERSEDAGLCRTFPAIISGNSLATVGTGSNGKEPGI